MESKEERIWREMLNLGLDTLSLEVLMSYNFVVISGILRNFDIQEWKRRIYEEGGRKFIVWYFRSEGQSFKDMLVSNSIRYYEDK